MNKVFIFLLFNILLTTQVNAFPVDGKKVNVGHQDMILLNQNTCIAYGGIEKYEAWKFQPPTSYVSSRVYCNLIKAEDGQLRRNVFDCNNQKGKWMCDLIATELKYILPPPINFIFANSTYLSDKELMEVIDGTVSIALDSDMYHEASCNVDNKTHDNRNLYIVECDHKRYTEILKTCDGPSCKWTIVNTGNVFN